MILQKKNAFILTVLLLLAFLSACQKTVDLEPSAYQDSDLNQLDGVTMLVTPTEYPVTTESIALTIKNESNEEHSYGVEFKLEKEIAGEWYEVPFEGEVSWIMIAYILEANSENNETISFDLLDKNTLNEGNYRLIKQISGQAVSATLTLTE
ncbi:hypothetical protein BW721_07965 [Jeotgalibaca sp. PTS2502]|uniref:immunoglobulin-like domain-containing protein n=1 Tax=Jeotgalibaca sp. PTS2502 TaxID=1903686 RepID=UPI0009739A59|nr:immunoglobulin-like domain-containing protein [Jeotgalibaca sp. PTS2502]APZ49599.1 hypothetical protein BW721_07965 [Jeotgalibaca sp. PTS2502]